MDRKVFADIKSKCVTKRQMRAFNELVKSFADKGDSKLLKQYNEYATNIQGYMVAELKYNKNEVEVKGEYDPSTKKYYIYAKRDDGKYAELSNEYLDNFKNPTDDDIADAAYYLDDQLS